MFRSFGYQDLFIYILAVQDKTLLINIVVTCDYTSVSQFLKVERKQLYIPRLVLYISLVCIIKTKTGIYLVD